MLEHQFIKFAKDYHTEKTESDEYESYHRDLDINNSYPTQILDCSEDENMNSHEPPSPLVFSKSFSVPKERRLSQKPPLLKKNTWSPSPTSTVSHTIPNDPQVKKVLDAQFSHSSPIESKLINYVQEHYHTKTNHEQPFTKDIPTYQDSRFIEIDNEEVTGDFLVLEDANFNIPLETTVEETETEFNVYIRSIPATKVSFFLESKSLLIKGDLPPLEFPKDSDFVLLHEVKTGFQKVIQFPMEVDPENYNIQAFKEISLLKVRLKKLRLKVISVTF